MVTYLANANTVVLIVTVISAFGVLLWTLEHLSRWHLFRDAEVYGWANLKSRWRFPARDDPLSRSLNALLGFPGVLVLLGSRAAAALLLVASPWTETGQFFGLGVIYATNVLLFNLRLPTERGSDGLTNIVFGALFLRQFAGDSPIVTEACLWFIALQVCLSFGACGVRKLVEPAWRDGRAILNVADHQLYGSHAVARFLYERLWLSKLLSWGTVIMESLFPLVLVLGYPACWVFLGWGVVFHSLNATVLGVNSFFWTFLATYPAIVYCVLRADSLLYG